MNNLEWLYENDESFAYGANKFVVDDGYSCCETIDQAHRWLLSDHVDGANRTRPDGNGTASDDCGQIADMSEKSADCVRDGGGMSEDSREKLEADIDKALDFDYITENMVLCWLDRQAAIAERECLVRSVQGADAILTAENAELQQQVDNLQRKLEAATQANDDYREEYHRLSQERMNLARDLGNCMAERDQLREKYSKAIDHALAICNDFDLI